jgi:hypothetical protein
MATTKGPTTTKAKTAGGEVSVNLNKLKTALQAAVAELQRLTQESGKADAAGKAGAAAGAGVKIQIWEDEPFLKAMAGADSVAAEPITVDGPENGQPLLQTHILDEQPDPGIFDPSSPEFRYWNAASALARGINFWGPLLPSGTVWSTVRQPMHVQMDEGVDFNAFYARDSGLNFFHGVVDNVDPPVTVFSGESPDVVCHELGHAILDAVKPELFDTPSSEVGAFHEAFGDISSTLSALQLPSIRQFVLEQTGANLNSNSRLSQQARQLGWAIRIQFDPTAVDTDSSATPATTSSTRTPQAFRRRPPQISYPPKSTRSHGSFPARSSTCSRVCSTSAPLAAREMTPASSKPFRRTWANS